ncbi:hypothetical protein N665_5834s0002 [Sinapis alba]|nr:hypothetical protein N665_5834s0002 [Sinapis alba]
MSLDIKRPISNKTKKKKTGFIVNMQLNHNNRGGGGNNLFIVFFRHYYKWILWFFLSLYLFTSYFPGDQSSPSPTTTITTNNLISNHKTSSSLPSHALIESPAIVKQSHTSIFSGMKIYVYELPARFNVDWVTASDRCASHLFAAEVAIHRALLSDSSVRTLDPEEADFFFVPVYVSCNFSTTNGFPSLSHARSLISSAVDFISDGYPFWNRTRGSDHVFVASHDFGACFHAMEDMAIEQGIPEFMKKSIILQTFGVNYKHPCQEAEHVVIPPYISPESVQRAIEKAPASRRRDIWAFFRGKMEVNPKNISGRYYSKCVRSENLFLFPR